MLNPEYSKQFKKDYKRAEKRGLKIEELKMVMRRLAYGEVLEAKYHDHVLQGKYKGFGECHVRPDLLLIYLKEEENKRIVFVRTGTHSDLFE